MPDINAYLRRIHYDGPRIPTLAVLQNLHTAHLLAIPYENLDIHLGQYVPLGEEAAFEKIVVRGRGGWCYEMNGLFAWALRTLGFEVALLASDVGRDIFDGRAEGDHLVLLVTLDQPYLVDVGFGNGFLQPLPLQAGHYRQGFLHYQLVNSDDHWRLINHPYGASHYDFTLAPQAMDSFQRRCHHLQTSPDSGFVRLTSCHRFTTNGLISLRGAVFRTVTEAGLQEETLTTEQAYGDALAHQFGLALAGPEISRLWAFVWQKHQEFTNQQG
jgi:N-hydroxyarylamine O-acetyltransferase